MNKFNIRINYKNKNLKQIILNLLKILFLRKKLKILKIKNKFLLIEIYLKLNFNKLLKKLLKLKNIRKI